MRFNHLLVLAAAIVHWIAGALWYAAFTGPFTRFMGEATLAQLQTRSEAVAFGLAFASSLGLAYALAYISNLRAPTGTMGQLQLAVIVTLGFVASTQSSTVVFESRHPGLYVLALGYQFVAVAIMSLVLTARRRTHEDIR